MRERRGKIFGIVLILAAFFLLSVNSLAATSLSITDTDPTTYIIVAMLMLFFLILFSAKEDVGFSADWKSTTTAILLFAAYILLFSYARGALSFDFISYRIDALLFPLALFAMIVAYFGFSGLNKLKLIPIYALFASPIVFLPILELNQRFALLNATAVYDFLKGLGIPITQSGLTIAASAFNSITISTTCVSLGTFVAFVMFLIPVAYFYSGRLKGKLLWLLSGLALMLLLNYVRMIGIALNWVYYGSSSAINLFHLFAGQILFYAVIIIMLLIAGRYGLRIERVSVRTDSSSVESNGAIASIALLLILFGIIGLFLSAELGSAVYAPSTSFGNSTAINQSSVAHAVLSSVEQTPSNVMDLGTIRPNTYFTIQNSTNTNESVFVIATPSQRELKGASIGNLSSQGDYHSAILKNGITVTSLIAKSENRSFELNYFAMPYNISGNYVSVNFELYKVIGSKGDLTSCAADQGLPDSLESVLYNFLNLHSNNSDAGFFCDSYAIASTAK